MAVQHLGDVGCSDMTTCDEDDDDDDEEEEEEEGEGGTTTVLLSSPPFPSSSSSSWRAASRSRRMIPGKEQTPNGTLCRPKSDSGGITNHDTDVVDIDDDE
jgi:hypothetical protein